LLINYIDKSFAFSGYPTSLRFAEKREPPEVNSSKLTEKEAFFD
jgi:hypothetical protein